MKKKLFPKPKHFHVCPGYQFKGAARDHKEHIYGCFNKHCQVKPDYRRICGLIVDALIEGHRGKNVSHIAR